MTATTRGPSAHLSWAELRCKDGTEYPERWRSTRAIALGRAFEALRATVGLPLVVLSGFRTPTHNRKVGGARNSQHLHGRALDLRPPAGWTPLALASVARHIAGIHGLGIYEAGHFVHIDTRPATRLVVWYGARATADFPTGAD